jgi:hypothetical protein
VPAASSFLSSPPFSSPLSSSPVLQHAQLAGCCLIISSCYAGSVHPYFFACQYHPEFQSNPHRPSPPFLGLILAATDSLKAAVPFTSASRVAKGLAAPSTTAVPRPSIASPTETTLVSAINHTAPGSPIRTGIGGGISSVGTCTCVYTYYYNVFRVVVTCVLALQLPQP